MKIKEYKVVQKNNVCTLEIIKEHDYNGRCSTEKSTVKMLNEIFTLNKLEVEHVYVIARDKRKRILGVYHLGSGNEMECYFDLKEMFTFLFLIGADGFEMAHNHIFNLWWEPSFEDLDYIKKMFQYENDFGISFLENYVICKDKYSAKLNSARTNEVVFYDLNEETKEVMYVTDKCICFLAEYIKNNEEIIGRIKYDEEIEISVCGAVAYITEEEKERINLFIKTFN